MGRTLPLLLAVTAVAAGCSGSSESTPTNVAATSSPATTGPVDTAPPATEATPTTTTESAPTTIDEATVLDDVEAAYLLAFEVGKEAIRNPTDPNTEQQIRAHFTGPSLDTALENWYRAVDGNYIAKVNEANPTFATVIERAEFVDDDPLLARLTVCEFNSDQIFEVATGPDGIDSLRRDDPVSILIVIRMRLEDGHWLSETGNSVEEVRDEVEACSGVL